MQTKSNLGLINTIIWIWCWSCFHSKFSKRPKGQVLP